MDEEERKREEEKAKHEKTKKTLKTLGLILTACGAILTIICFIDFFSTMYSFSGMPKLFFLGFIGLPMLGIGIMLLTWGNRSEIGRYVKNESVPVVNEAVQELKPSIEAVVGAVKGTGETEKKENVCPSCGKVNQPDNNFCDGCGARLHKVCPHCGARQEAGDKFCGNCGAEFED